MSRTTNNVGANYQLLKKRAIEPRRNHPFLIRSLVHPSLAQGSFPLNETLIDFNAPLSNTSDSSSVLLLKIRRCNQDHHLHDQLDPHTEIPGFFYCALTSPSPVQKLAIDGKKTTAWECNEV